MNSIQLTQPNATIAQISDLHLSDESSFANFTQVLRLALSHSPDLLILTGDLVNDGKSRGYDWLFDTLSGSGVPFVCLAGNHDVTMEIGHELPFSQRTFLPTQADDRLTMQGRFLVHLPKMSWQILSVNSAVGGQIYGHLSSDDLQFLRTHLANQLPTIIALHHHPQPVGSAWIDAYMLDNHDEFWQAVAPFDNIKAVLCGHVHQAHHITTHNTALLTCPATSRQFLPYHDDFAIDDIGAGFRLIHMSNKGELATAVKRV